jgi:hypothetical protein
MIKCYARAIWNIGIVEEPIRVFLQPRARPRVHWLLPLRKDRFLAEPFGISKNGMLYILCEEFDYRLGKGRIVCIELNEGMPPPEPQPAIQLPIHVSHPYLLEHQGTIYCVPETYEARKVDLYRAKTFPLEWEKIPTLVDNFAGVDPTVFRYEDRWWLMRCDHDTGPFDRLFVWHARDLFGTWIPHPANPVKVNIDSSRLGNSFRTRGAPLSSGARLLKYIWSTGRSQPSDKAYTNRVRRGN